MVYIIYAISYLYLFLKVVLFMKFYVITFSSGHSLHGLFNSYSDCLTYVENHKFSDDFTIEEYDSEDDYINNL